jgi:hypothetical protein
MKKIFILFSGIVLSIHGFSQSWSITGNAGTNSSTNFLGTTDTARLVFRTNDVEHATILQSGYVGIGISTPQVPLQFYNSSGAVMAITGTVPALYLWSGATNNNYSNGALGFATQVSDFVGGSQPGDFILQNNDTAHSIIFGTNQVSGDGLERLRINKIGYVGIDKPAPTARLDVNCATLSGQTNPSNIRLESLQSGSGTVLVIDSNGYVYKSASGATDIASTPLTTELQSQVEELKNQVQELRSLLTSKVPLTTAEAANLNAESTTWLSGVYPNPANTAATIEYSLPAGAGAAVLQVYSVGGQPITSIALPASSGKNQVQLTTSQLPAGMYICALVVNGKVLDSKSLAVIR